MSNLRTITRRLFLITGPTVVAMLILLEVCFRAVIPASNPPESNWNYEFRLSNFKNKPDSGIYTIGKYAKQQGKWRINNYGWNSPTDYAEAKTKRRIAVIGDSYVEAFQVDTEKSFHALLRDKIGHSTEVFSMGKSGAPLSHYLHVSRYANELFEPDIVIFSMVQNDFGENLYHLYPEKSHFLTLNVIGDGIFVERLPDIPKIQKSHRSNLRSLLRRRSAFVRYLYFNLRIGKTINKIRNSNVGGKYEANVAMDKVVFNKALIGDAVDYILREIFVENCHKEVIFILDGHRKNIYLSKPRNATFSYLAEQLEDSCLYHGFSFINLDKIFRDIYRKEGKEFNSKWDNHWNEYGHRKVSEILLNHLEDNKIL